MNDNIFQAVQERYTVKEVAEQLGIILHRVGGSYRADSIDGSGDGRDAFAIYEKSNTWYDFKLKIGGDVTDLVAFKKFNGNKGEALRELMPDCFSEKVRVQISKSVEFQKDIERWHNDLMNPNKPMSVRALSYLHSRKITDETIKKFKIGVMSYGASNRLVFPYSDESGKKVIYFTTRRYDWSGQGENEKEPKYMKASLEKYPFLKNSLFGLNTLDRGNDTLIVTEGTVDGLCFAQEGYSVLVTNGGDFGKLTKQFIEKAKDFKNVILAFDKDEAGREFAYKVGCELVKARIYFDVAFPSHNKDFAELYANYGTSAAVDILMDNSRKGINWCMEYLRPTTPLSEMTGREREQAFKKCNEFVKEISAYVDAADIREMTMCLSSVFSKDWINELVKTGKRGMTEDEVADAVLAEHNLMFNEKIGFFEYTDKKIWEKKDDYYVMSYIGEVYGENATGNKLTSTLKRLKTKKEVLNEIPLKMFNTQPLITFQNGTLHFDLNLGTVILKESSSTDYTTVKLPFRYDPNATCKKWRKFVKEITNGNEDAQKVLQEFAGYIFLPTNRFQKALILKGRGANGKSVFVNVLAQMLGGFDGYVSYVEPSKLSKDFRLMPFKNSLLNVSSDTENNFCGGEGNIKKLIAGETVEDSYKYKDPFSFPTRSKMVMCCNDFPTVNDTSDGFMRRFLIVNFPMHYVSPNNFHSDTNERIIDPFLEDELIKELPGIFNWAIEGLQRLLKQNGFTETKEQNSLINEFVKHSNHLMAFAEDNKKDFFEENGEGKTIEKKRLFRSYRQWCDDTNHFAKSSVKFFAGIVPILERLGWKFKEENGFWNFGVDDDSEIEATTSTPEQENSDELVAKS